MEALYKRQSQVRRTITQVIADIEPLRQLDRPPICELRNIHRILIYQYNELRRIDKEVEDAVDIDNLEAEVEEAEVCERQVVLEVGT